MTGLLGDPLVEPKPLILHLGWACSVDTPLTSRFGSFIFLFFFIVCSFCLCLSKLQLPSHIYISYYLHTSNFFFWSNFMPYQLKYLADLLHVKSKSGKVSTFPHNYTRISSFFFKIFDEPLAMCTLHCMFLQSFFCILKTSERNEDANCP